MKADLAKREPQWLSRWQQTALYQGLLDRKTDKTFVLHDGPPYANGELHFGHVENNTLKDFVTRYQTIIGAKVKLVPGWDCHGLPIEQNVEKKLGSKKSELTGLQYRKLCRLEAEKWVAIQSVQRQRLGMYGTWDAPYLTMQPEFEARVLEALAFFADRGLLYRGRKPVWWSTAEATALAESELEYENEHKSPSVYVRFAANSAAISVIERAFGLTGKLAKDAVVHAVIWTTTPWTLPANMALALHPSLKYELIERVENGRTEYVLVAADLRQELQKACGWSVELTVHAAESAVGAAFVGALFQHPFEGREVPAVTADYVEATSGTGIVHTAPGHGRDDYMTGTRHGLAVYSPVDDRGRYTHELGDGAKAWGLEGKTVWEANPIIASKLAEIGALCNKPTDFIIHKYPISWRSKKPLITRATVQWFIAMDHPMESGTHLNKTLREVALSEIDRLADNGATAEKAGGPSKGWVPAWGRDRITGMIAARPDWCISRQRLWGVPIPALECIDCGHVHLDAALIRHVATLFAKHGTDVWYDPASDVIPAGLQCPKCGKSQFKRDQSILDVWFESGSSFFAVCEGKEMLKIPTDLYLEGSDQHRGWFHSSLLVGVATHGRAPYETVVTHGFIGEKVQKTQSDGRVKEVIKAMHKTEINQRKEAGEDVSHLDPLKIIASDGADLLRLWVASNDFTGDVGLSKEAFKQASETYRSFRNSLRFLLANVGANPPAIEEVAAELQPIDRWMYDRLVALVDGCNHHYETYNFRAVASGVSEFLTDASGFYFDVAKDWLYNDAPSAIRTRSTLAIFAAILRSILTVMAPILPFTVEDAWDHFPKRADDPASVHQTRWPSLTALAPDPAIERAVTLTRALRQRSNAVLEPLVQAWGIEKQLAKKEAREPGVGNDRFPESLRIDHARDAEFVLYLTSDEQAELTPMLDTLAEALLAGTVAVRPTTMDPATHVQRSSTPPCGRCRRRIAAVDPESLLCPRCTEAIRQWDLEHN